MIKQLMSLLGAQPITDASVAPRPWRLGNELERESLMIFDANGRHIATVDEWLQLPEDEARVIADMIVASVNGANSQDKGNV